MSNRDDALTLIEFVGLIVGICATAGFFAAVAYAITEATK